MFGKWLLGLLVPLALAATLAACANNGVQPGVVSTSSGSTATASTYGNAVPGDPGRVVAINDVSLAGSGGGGSGRGPLIGGLLGAGGGAAIGAATSHSVVGGLVGGLLGAVGGAIVGTIFDNHGGTMSSGRGIEVTVQKDDGQTVKVAQRDDGDIQLGDRVQIVQGRGGVAKVVRDNSRAPDPQQNGAPPPDYRQSRNYGPPPQDYGPPPGHGPTSRDYSPDYTQSRTYPPPRDNGPPPQDYRQSDYRQPQGGNYPQPQDDPRYGTLN
jgi:outer membrane lipoprotein SlyB